MHVGSLKLNVIYLEINNSELMECVMGTFILGFKKRSPNLFRTSVFSFAMLHFLPQVPGMSVLTRA